MFAWAGILCMAVSVIVGLLTLSGGFPRQAEAFWLPLLILLMGWGLVIRGWAGVSAKQSRASLQFLRACYLVKALEWMLAGALRPEWGYDYWRGLIPLVDLCGTGDLILIAIWCSLENLAMAAACGWLLSRRSFVPFWLACLSALHAVSIRNPLLLATAFYLMIRTGPWALLATPQEISGADIGFDAA